MTTSIQTAVSKAYPLFTREEIVVRAREGLSSGHSLFAGASPFANRENARGILEGLFIRGVFKDISAYKRILEAYAEIPESKLTKKIMALAKAAHFAGVANSHLDTSAKSTQMFSMQLLWQDVDVAALAPPSEEAVAIAATARKATVAATKKASEVSARMLRAEVVVAVETEHEAEARRAAAAKANADAVALKLQLQLNTRSKVFDNLAIAELSGVPESIEISAQECTVILKTEYDIAYREDAASVECSAAKAALAAMSTKFMTASAAAKAARYAAEKKRVEDAAMQSREDLAEIQRLRGLLTACSLSKNMKEVKLVFASM